MATSRTRTWIVGSMAGMGIVLGAAGIAGAATGGSSDTGASTTAPAAAATVQGQAPLAPPTGGGGTPIDPSSLANGPGETLLTGDTAAKVTAAAEAAVPGGTIIRVETDAQGAAYEAHVQEADGSIVTVTFDESYTLVDTQHGFGAPPAGTAPTGAPPTGAAPTGTPPTGAPSTGTGSTTSSAAAA